jgi:hypothetical protein
MTLEIYTALTLESAFRFDEGQPPLVCCLCYVTERKVNTTFIQVYVVCNSVYNGDLQCIP